MKKRKRSFVRGLTLMLAVFAALYFCGYALFERIGDSSQAAETELVEQAVRTAALTCYAVEGAYPLGLEYLKKNYGLVYNDSLYIVSYDAFASNVMPEIRVLERGAGM